MEIILASRLTLIGAVGLAGMIVGGGLLLRANPDLSVLPVVVQVAVGENTALFVQVNEVTIAQWNRCYNAGTCKIALAPPRGGDAADYPATGLNAVDVQDYVRWINKTTRQDFRLPTAAEWRVIARDVMPDTPDPIFTDPALSWASTYQIAEQYSRRLLPSGSNSVTADGVWDLDGNVSEWTQDCYSGTSDLGDISRCPAFIVEGLHEAVMPFLERDPARGGCAVGAAPAHLGMRLVSDRPLPLRG